MQFVHNMDQGWYGYGYGYKLRDMLNLIRVYEACMYILHLNKQLRHYDSSQAMSLKKNLSIIQEFNET